MRRALIGLAAVLPVIAGAEGLARLAFDFPLYGADREVGYWPLPDQQGAFLFTNDWAFDGDSLGVEEDFAPSGRFDLLLVGDSIVYGGNSLRQAEKLGPLLEARTGWQVWPAGAGSWALQNELAFLRRKPELVSGADAIVFVLNSGDFGAPSEWRSAYTHPRERPRLFLPYLFARYVLKSPGPEAPPFPVPQRDPLGDWLAFARTAGKPVFVMAHSTQEESGRDCRWVPRQFREAGRWACFDALAEVGPGGFADEIHPSVKGYRVLAKRIEAMIESAQSH